MLTEEQKLLKDTKAEFWKTACYFSQDGHRYSPQEFFQIWASFLHDCKYYWKLAHRNLAKTKFNSHLITKSQLQDVEKRAKKAQQMQHINSWIESVGRCAMNMPPESEGYKIEPVDNAVLSSRSMDILHPGSQTEKHNSEAAASPQYTNQHVSSSVSYLDQTSDFIRPSEKENKYGIKKEISTRNCSKHDNQKAPGASSSPKSIKAISPNVIIAHSINDKSPKISDPSLGVQSLPLVSYQPAESTDGNNNKYAYGSCDELFDFEPLYESLSNPSQNYTDVQANNHSKHPLVISDEVNGGPLRSMSPDFDTVHKKNAKFLKSLLKKDSKKVFSSVESTQTSQHSSLNTFSTPFAKLRNTFVQKLSYNSNTKKLSHNSQKISFEDIQNVGNEISPKPLREVPIDHDPLSSIGIARFDQERKGDVKTNNVNYPFYECSGQAQNNEVSNTVNNFPACSNGADCKDRNDSMAYNIRSLQNISSQKLSQYQQNYDGPNDKNDYGRYPRKDQSNTNRSSFGTDNTDSRNGSVRLSSRARARAPIDLGRHMSISDVYCKSTDSVSSPTTENQDHPPLGFAANDLKVSECGPKSNMQPGGSSDSKLVKANAVPVYKAKLIPTYENQSKYDSWLGGGVKGQAEDDIRLKHQISISSEMYRQELQKKSEKYVSGGIYPIHVPKGKNSLSKSRSPGTVTLSKPNHYHASPIIISQYMSDGNSSMENYSNTNAYAASENECLEISPVIDQNPKHQSEESKTDRALLPPGNSSHQSKHSEIKPSLNSGDKSELLHDSRVSLCKRETTGIHHCDPLSQGISSTHNALEKYHESMKSDKAFHFAYASPNNLQTKSPKRISRRDQGEKKHTPTSQNQPPQAWNDVPSSVTSLIDRFEKKSHLNNLGVGLLDMDDKPPSMTSTPVIRRKNLNTKSTPPDSTGRFLTLKEEKKGRSHSEGSKRSSSRHGVHSSKKHTDTTIQKHANSDHISQGHTSTIFHAALSCANSNWNMNDCKQQSQTSSMSSSYQTSAWSSNRDHHKGNYQQNSSMNKDQYTQLQSNYADYGTSEIVNTANIEVTSNQLNNKTSSSHRLSSFHSYKQHANNEGVYALGDCMLNESRSNDSKHSYKPEFSRIIHTTPTVSCSSSVQSNNCQSAVLLELEPQYYNQSLHSPQDLSKQQFVMPVTDSFSQSVYSHPHYPHPYTPSSNYNPQPQQQKLQVTNTFPHSVDQHEAHFPSYYTDKILGAQIVNDNNPYIRQSREELHHNSKPGNSVFEHSLKSTSPHVHQKGAVAIIKPTVMNQ